jgi:hypothetical protein
MLILEVIMVKDGTMNLVIGIWEEKTTKGDKYTNRR